MTINEINYNLRHGLGEKDVLGTFGVPNSEDGAFQEHQGGDFESICESNTRLV